MGSVSCCNEKDSNLDVEKEHVVASVEVPVEPLVVQADPEPTPEPERPLPAMLPTRLGSRPRITQLASSCLEAHRALARGKSIREVLRDGLFWRQGQGNQAWESASVVKGFDVFLSHAWQTPGVSKVLSLLLQSGWPQMVTCWALGAAAAFVLCLQDGLPLPWAFTARALEEEATCPLGLWILVFSTGAALLGLVASVYTPTCIRMRDICFLDVMSIHQTDAALKEKGIYGIGGFLSLSSELRVLWSPPYLTRLWCIFELAAFRKANPRGVIRLAPLFVEVSVLCMCLASSCASLLFWMVHTANPELLLYVVACSVVLSAMCCMLVHFLRRSMQGKQQLLSALQDFDLSQVGCRDEYDRDFIYRAIQQWYGSLEAFTDFVRHTLQEELAATLGSEQVVRVYSFLPCLPVLSVGLEYWLAFAKAGVSTTWQVSFIVGVLLGFAVFWSTLSFRVLLTLCSWLAAPRLWPLDYLQSLLIFAAFAIFWCGGLFLATWAYAQSFWAMLGWASVSVLASASVMRK